MTSDLLNNTTDNTYKIDDLIYKLCLGLFLFGFATFGFGNFIVGIELPTNVSTFTVYIIFIIQLLTNSLRFSKFLLYLWIYIFVQTFVLNWNYINLPSSSKYFVGFVLFSLVRFSFFSKNRHRIVTLIQSYYKFCFFIACLGIIQVFLFSLFNLSFLPQNIISGSLAFQGNNSFQADILGIIPRAVGLSTEPAHYVVLLLPAVYIAIYTLTGSGNLFNIKNRNVAGILLFGFIISFSLVGYFGLGICLFIIFGKNVRVSFLKAIILFFGFGGLVYFILQTPIGDKVYSFISVSSDIKGADYTTGDQSSFALLSNLMVSFEGLKISHGLGTGLNSHVVTYDGTLSKIFSVSQIPSELNKENAGSMFIRILSEFGIPGLLIFIWFLKHFRIVTKNAYISSNTVLNNMCFVFLIMYSFRNGDYLNIIFFFFFAMFYYTYNNSIVQNNLTPNE